MKELYSACLHASIQTSLVLAGGWPFFYSMVGNN